MIRVLLLLVLLPAPALAQWTPTPRSFAFDATFSSCVADPTNIDAAKCDALLRDAFDLNVAVTRAVEACGLTPLGTCPVPFEERGLPAFAARIASEADCIRTDLALAEPFRPLPANHCITMISDILRDEGVVPLREAGLCDEPNPDCTDLRAVHSGFWNHAILSLADTPMMHMRLDSSWNACFESSPIEDALLECHIVNLSRIWTYLAQQQLET